MKKFLGKDPCNSRKLGKVVAIYETNRLVLSKKVNVLKNSEKLTHPKSSCLRLFSDNFFLQLIKYSVSGIILSNDRYRGKNCHKITVRCCCRTHLTLFILGVCRSVHPSFKDRCFLKNELIILRLNDFYFHRTVFK